MTARRANESAPLTFEGLLDGIRESAWTDEQLDAAPALKSLLLNVQLHKETRERGERP